MKKDGSLARYRAWIEKNTAPLIGQYAVVTGGNSGIGFAAARLFLFLGASVTLACRNEERARAAAAALLQEFPEARVDYAILDLAENRSIDAFCEKVAQRGEKIDVFLHCAGVYYPKETRTKDGLAATVGINFYGTARLANAILPQMDETGRMIFTTSLVDRFGKLRQGKKKDEKEGFAAYAESKLRLSAFVIKKAAARKEGEPRLIATHPGITATSLLDASKTSHKPLFSRLGHAFLFLFTQEKEKAALTALFAAAGNAENGAIIAPRGLFGISGYPHRTKFCKKARRGSM